MTTNKLYYRRKQLLGGAALIGVGTLFLLDRLDLLELELRQLWHYWPLILVALGVNKLLPPTSPRHILGGLWLIYFAAWYYISFEQMWGMSFGVTWPFLLIGWGVGLVLEPLLNRHFFATEYFHEK
ncbi:MULTISPECIES: LiaF transmembrane domain-containing protein [unclassified Janthinobacterium]|uniref:LiaF transmembrane domain-containing protein n=1 Tax=unclassified Janthinobacterium TaxID=2610881 RepID=UPI00034DBBF9|nr:MULTISPECIES: DUF5668 domain-containing protein [unclassified Janthinobacterium]MEC5163172.1 hypothetical protein [Janthinobacterium sp. CG_S6]